MKRRLTAAAAILMLALAGCSSATEPSQSDPLLADHGLAGLTGQQIVDQLEALPEAERPADLIASVRPAELLLSDDAGRETSVDLPDDLFYLALAPYVDGTHECFYHSLTTCLGELGGQDIQVSITGDDGTVIVDEQATVNPNGFISYWVPRGAAGTVEVVYDGRSGSYAFTTDDEAPTCVTTVQLT